MSAKNITVGDENITVGSAHVDLSPHFREQAQQQIRAAAQKHLGNLTMASVHVAQEGTYYRCSVNMQMGSLNAMSGEAKARDVPLAFRTALGKLKKQLRRTKRAVRQDRQNRPDRITTA